MKQLLYVFLMVLLGTACSHVGENKRISTDDQSEWEVEDSVAFGKEGMTLSGIASKAWTKTRCKNFELNLECKTDSGAKGGIVFHNSGSNDKNIYRSIEIIGYEVFINNNNLGEEVYEWYKTGSLSSVRNIAKRTAVNNAWFPIKIEVIGKQIKIFVNNIFVVDYTEPEKPFREDEFRARVLSEGVFLFYNRSMVPIAFRNIQVKQLPDDATNQSEAIDESNDPIIRLQQQNFPLIDYHLHLKGGWTKEEAAAQSRKYGINYAIAPNCGKNFPITDDKGISAWLDSMQHQPFLLPMQAEGREWVAMFSKEAIDKFDYRFTDAMTWTDHKGRRLRLWIPEETFVDDKEQFMDMLVDRACEIMATEPIDVYVNPTFLPEHLQPEYDKLWTPERMQRVIDACVKNDKAIEINNRYRIPSPAFIKMAKQYGAKFTFGTNNTSPADVGKLEYSIEMIKECGLQPQDMYIPQSN